MNEHIHKLGRRYPGIWKIIDQIRQTRRAEDPAWPDYIYLPLEKSSAALVQWYRNNDPTHPLHPSTIVRPASELAGMSAWRITQGVYRYDPDLYAALIDTPMTGDVPAELLRHLPEWCLYLETPGMTTPAVGGGEVLIHGVWAWLDTTAKDQTDILTIMLHNDGQPAITHVPLVGNLDQAFDRVESDWREGIHCGNADGMPMKGFSDAAKRTLTPILSLLLYLCSEEPDINDRTHPGEQPGIPKPKRTKIGYRLFAADKTRIWTVGEAMGNTLRQSRASAEPTGRSVSPHIRRAHWHGFWTGPKDGERVFRIKWLPPMIIGG